MKEIKNFKLYEPLLNDSHPLHGKAILFLKSEDGHDWYESQSLFSDKTLKVIFDSKGNVSDFSVDVSTLWPINLSVAEVENTGVAAQMVRGGKYTYANGMISVREYSVDELQEQAQKKKNELLAKADTAIAPLERAVKLGIATDKEQASLEAWERFSVRVNRVNTKNVPAEFPEAPDLIEGADQ